MVSIIIPLKKDLGYLQPCVEACLAQKGDDLEVIVLPDEKLAFTHPRIIQEVTGDVSPARKRNRGAKLSRGEILAFIDDDTRPLAGWLEAALPHFQDPRIAAVGGPSITPSDDPFWAQVSGAVYESWMMSGQERRRYRPQKECDVQDFPSCNLLVRRSAFQEVGGFGTDFWPGEDTEFCLALVKKGYRIRYEPRAVIEHHRRPSLQRHFIQLGNYGLHRGYFVKRFPETSFRLQYFLPSICVVAGTGLFITFLFGSMMSLWILAILSALYFFFVIVSLRDKPLEILIVSTFIIFFSHMVYGIYFVKGLLVSRLPEEMVAQGKS